ncbi:hypothetical protein HN51_032147 [Arachis hypogaea]
MASRSMNAAPSVLFKQPDTNGVVSGELSNGKVMNASSNREVTGPSSEGISNQAGRAAPPVHGKEQSVSDPVQLMRMFAESLKGLKNNKLQIIPGVMLSQSYHQIDLDREMIQPMLQQQLLLLVQGCL